MSEPETLEGLVWAAIDELPTVLVQWAPAHTAPFVSRELVKPVVMAVIEDYLAAARADLLTELRAAVEGLEFEVPDGDPWSFMARALVSRAAVLALLEPPR